MPSPDIYGAKGAHVIDVFVCLCIVMDVLISEIGTSMYFMPLSFFLH